MNPCCKRRTPARNRRSRGSSNLRTLRLAVRHRDQAHASPVIDARLVHNLANRRVAMGIEASGNNAGAEADGETRTPAAVHLVGGRGSGKSCNSDGGGGSEGDDGLAEHGSFSFFCWMRISHPHAQSVAPCLQKVQLSG